MDETKKTRALLLDYARAVIDDDWPALRDNRLGVNSTALLRDLEASALNLAPDNVVQEALWARILASIDVISDYRLSRLQQAVSQPPFFLIVVLFGFFVTMVCFGLYRPVAPIVVLVSLYVAFVGLLVYLILAFSDPFQGVPGVDTAPIDVAIEKMLEYQ